MYPSCTPAVSNCEANVSRRSLGLQPPIPARSRMRHDSRCLKLCGLRPSRTSTLGPGLKRRRWRSWRTERKRRERATVRTLPLFVCPSSPPRGRERSITGRLRSAPMQLDPSTNRALRRGASPRRVGEAREREGRGLRRRPPLRAAPDARVLQSGGCGDGVGLGTSTLCA
jgi:hypothetical protein